MKLVIISVIKNRCQMYNLCIVAPKQHEEENTISGQSQRRKTAE